MEPLQQPSLTDGRMQHCNASPTFASPPLLNHRTAQVSTGMYNNPFTPTFVGQAEFAGKIMHSSKVCMCPHVRWANVNVRTNRARC